MYLFGGDGSSLQHECIHWVDSKVLSFILIMTLFFHPLCAILITGRSEVSLRIATRSVLLLRTDAFFFNYYYLLSVLRPLLIVEDF